MATYTYPTAAELRAVEQVKLPVLTQDDPIFTILPIETADEFLLMWEQSDNYTGLQQVRGLNGSPNRVQRVGAKTFMMQPGVYGEFIRIDELQLTSRRQWGTFGTPITIDDLVMSAQDQLLSRRVDLIRYIGWTLLATGTFSVALPQGGVGHTDSFTLQTYTATVPWATTATAAPLANLRELQLLSRGKGVDFGAGATLYVNRKTANSLFANTNDADIYGKRTGGLANVLSLADANAVLAGEGLPRIVIYDEGYLNSAGTFVPFIADAKGVLVGRRTSGAAIGNYRMVRNANNPNLEPGAYTKVVDEESAVPRTIDVHDGHNGGPVLYHPSAIVVATF